MSDADWDSEPLLGTATLSRGALMASSEVGVDVVQADAAGEHEHLGVVEQLADLLGRALLALVLGGHPGLGRLLDQLLADRMDPGVELRDGAGPRGSLAGLLVELGPELVERLHDRPPYGVRRSVASTSVDPPLRGPHRTIDA